MQGEIGSLVQDGKQIGGFLEWTIDLKLISHIRAQNRHYKKVLTKATAQKFWLLSELLQGEITALYYQSIGHNLVLANQQIVLVKFPQYTLDKIINIPLEMICV